MNLRHQVENYSTLTQLQKELYTLKRLLESESKPITPYYADKMNQAIRRLLLKTMDVNGEITSYLYQSSILPDLPDEMEEG